jgi:3-oxoadipate enol-lactonase
MTLARYQGVDAVAAALANATVNNHPFEVVFVRESRMRLFTEEFTRSCEALGQAEKAEYRLLNCQELADRIGGANAVILNRCGHWTPIEKAKECGKLLSEFVRGISI